MKLLLLLLALHTPQPGIAKYYSSGVMERVAAHRSLCRWDSLGRCRPPWGVAGFASRVSCKTIGRVFEARINGHYERLLQVDCSAPVDAPRHLREHLVLEVDYATARRDGMIRSGRGNAVVWR